MTNRFITPNEQFANSAGVPYAGGQLFFYASGTSTPQATYSDAGLTIPNSNPIILDSAGRSGSVFLLNQAYKVVLEDVNSNIIWTMDPVYTSDVTALAQFNGFAGNPNGHLPGTQGSFGVPASVAWDYVNNILYVCTTTGNSLGAVWTAVNGAASQSNTPVPQGRLTLTAGTPVLSSDVVGATSVIYTAFNGNLIPIYNGASFSLQAFAADLTLTLVASHAADTIYDIFAFLNSGVLTLATGPAWSNSTAGSCARGTGAGTTQLARVSGIWTNNVQITGRNGSSTFTIPANQATYLGSMYMDHTAGQTTCHLSFGQNRKFGIWNAWNRQPIIVKAGDSTASWTYQTNTIRASNNVPTTYAGTTYNTGSGTAANGINLLTGLAEEIFDLSLVQKLSAACGSPTATTEMRCGVGFNSTTAFSGIIGEASINGAASSFPGTIVNATGRFISAPALGLNIAAALEVTPSGAANDVNTFFGTEANMILTASYKG